MRTAATVTAVLFIILMVAPAIAEEYGSITGIVTSANNQAIPDAAVTLWAIENGTAAQAVVMNNPQYTSNFSSSLPGAYVFTNVPPGVYNITAVWGSDWFYTQVNLTGGTVTANIVIPVYTDVLSIYQPTPIPTPKTYYTYVPVRLASPPPQATTRSPGFEWAVTAIALLIAMAARRRLKH
jgi:hypothetical protein